MQDIVVIEKILRSMTLKFDYVVCSIEGSNDLDILSINELQSSLLIHEQKMTNNVVEKQALKVTNLGKASLGRGREHQSSYNQGAQFEKSSIECFHCRELGHF